VNVQVNFSKTSLTTSKIDIRG